MFNSRFLKSSSYAVLSVSIVSVAQNANGFAHTDLNNRKKVFRNSSSKDVLLPSKQQGLKLDNATYINETKDKLKEENKKKDRIVWPWVIGGTLAVIVLLFVGGTFYVYRPYFKCGTKNFQELGFLEKIREARDLSYWLCQLKEKNQSILIEAYFLSIKTYYKRYFDLKEIFSLNGLDYEKIQSSFGNTEQGKDFDKSLIASQDRYFLAGG